MDKPKTVLVIAWGGIGDMICLTPALLALRKRYPGMRMVVLCENNTPRELISHWKGVCTLSMRERKFEGISGKLKMIKELRRFCFDVSVMNAVGPSFRSAVISLLSGARVRIGKSVRGRGFFNTIRFPEYRMHEVDTNFEIFRYLDVERGDEKPFVQIPEESFLFVDRWYEERKITARGIIGIHPGAGDKKKRWDKFGELMESFLRKGKKIVVFGTEDERYYIESIVPQNKCVFPFVGYSITQTSAMINRCELFIGNDSGLSHLASALSVPTVTIFGPSSWKRGRPYGDKSVIVKSNLPCSPCSWLGVGIKCRTLKCLKEIRVEDVYREAEKLMEGRKGVPVKYASR